MVPRQDHRLRALNVRKSGRIAIVFLALIPVSLCQTSGARDRPDEGKLVKMRLEKVQISSAAALARWSHSAAFGSNGELTNLTVDGKLAAQSATLISERLPDAGDALFSLDYELAKQIIVEVEQFTNSLNHIIDESQGVPLRRIELESTWDEQLGSVSAQLPAGSNPRQVRSLIFSEISFSDRMLKKAIWLECVPRSANKVDAVDSVLQKGFRTVEGRESDQYLKDARRRLLLLDYTESHRMAYQAYRSALESLANCPH
jgi:hypothetical protein